MNGLCAQYVQALCWPFVIKEVVMKKKVIMRKNLRRRNGIQSLINRHKKLFRIPENLNYYAPNDYKNAEGKYLIYALHEGKIEN
jgi:hypothetical protein